MVSANNAGRSGFEPWIGKIPWRRAWQPTPVFLPGKFPGHRRQATVHGVKESDTTERLSMHACMRYGRRKQIPSLERIRFLGCRAGWAQLFMRNGGFSPSRLWKRISLAVSSPGWCGRKVCLCTSSCTETALQERRIKQCLKENTVTVKYEKKTKAASPGTCQTHPDLLVVRITRWFSWALEWPWD